MKILITGAAGFIGFHTTMKFVQNGHFVVGIDNLNDYYSIKLKESRLSELGIDTTNISYGEYLTSSQAPGFCFIKGDITDRELLPAIFNKDYFDCVIHLAAQAGVRYSIINPWAYIESNIIGFFNILECCRQKQINHLVYASSSSIYGNNKHVPFSETDRVDEPESLYAATKKSDEILAACYSKLYDLRITGLRFFTVYGPWGRPDMAPILFANAITRNKTIKVFNNGNLLRDFTYVDDIVEGIMSVVTQPSREDSPSHNIYNIGCSNPVNLMDFITTMETAFQKTANKEMLPMQAGDVYQTYADTSALERDYGYKPQTSLKQGIRLFAEWYNQYSHLL